MTQKDVANKMDMTPRQIRYLVNSLRSKGYQVIASKGMFLSKNNSVTVEEVKRLNNAAMSMTKAARGMFDGAFYGIVDENLSEQEKILLSILPVIDEEGNKQYDSSEEFEYMEDFFQ